jgi:CHAT domain-containing protein/tetratricopeptide (TPR) repeat protein
MKTIFCYLNTVLLFIFITFTQNSSAQNDSISGITQIEKLITENELQKAETELNIQINTLKSQEKYNNLATYIYIVGKIKLLKNDVENSKIESKNLAALIQENTTDPKTLFTTNINLAKLFFELNNVQKAYDYALKAKTYASQLTDNENLLNSEYYLGDYGMKLGNIDLLELHIRKAIKIIKASPKKQYKIAARVYNLMGATMYYSSKQDSAIFYFETALKNIQYLEKNYENQLYLPAAIKGNLFLMYFNQGKHTEAKKFVEESLILSNTFLDKAKNHPLSNRVKRNIGIGYTNLSMLYNDIGNYNKSMQISKLSYNHTKQYFANNTQEFFMAALNLAELKNITREFDDALKYLNEAKACLSNMVDENIQLHAFLYNTYAQHAFKTEQLEKAIQYWSKSDSYYEKSNSGEFDTNRLYSKMNLAIAYADIGNKEKANATIKEPYTYFLNKNGENDYLTNELLVTLARISLRLKDYKESLKWTNKSLEVYKDSKNEEGYNKIQIEDKKAEVLLINAKSKYYLTQQRDSIFLKRLLKTTDEAIKNLEQKKSILTSIDDINTHLENNKEIISFAKKINLELYTITKNKNYLNKVISLHESIIYNRIRLRLNLRNNIAFSGIPKEIIKREISLKNQLSKSLNNNIEDFFVANKQWNSFLDSLKQTHPKYYKMRYATIEEPLDNLQNNIPNSTTVVRYLFIEDDLYAFVVDKTQKNIYKINSNNVKSIINQLAENQSEVSEISPKLHKLYEQLWKPFDKEVKTENVIIIPDDELFNLSFETLTPTKINTFKELATNSLLAKYVISYNYSLLLLDENRKTIDYSNDFIAFAPEFNDKMKDDYKIAITDSLNLDNTYLSLLPQPFSVDLAKQYSKLFKGESFLNENASKTIFINEANEHKIIHIGTHAESNNVSPELSRLIFAKNDEDEDNSLYTYEIYNQNLNSNLAILTACETGKPTYQSGEGMISLAHAFNYAGSESILTSLWKIDEQSSTQIIKYFYNYLAEGLSKDKALQQAKLDYIASAEGRTVSPQYWAGLVLIGDASPINISTSSNNLLFWIFGVLTIILIAVFFRKKRKAA